MTPADVEGMKIRVMNNDLYTAMISAMGGNPTPMAFSEVYQSLKTNVVDGAENNFPSFKNDRPLRGGRYYSLTEHLIIPECICVNPTSLRGAVAGASGGRQEGRRGRRALPA